MRYRDIRGGFSVPVSNEEHELLERIEATEGKQIPREELDEREQELARKMVSRGTLNRFRRDDSTVYVINDLDDIWRD